MIAPGTRLGPYVISAPIGAGGMGEVYKASDPRLGRDVAIKVLPAAFSADPERLHRFEQEARAAAALNHPNILAVHDIGQHDGSPYIVSELLEGETLRERLSGGALPVRKAVEYAVQIAHGLAAAHEKGIAHRDLKPENLFVTADGRVKILDFGLAKLTQAEPAVAGRVRSRRRPDTLPGVVLGTIGYMAPEQVRGLAADHRSDIFRVRRDPLRDARGQRAFHAATPRRDTMTAILKEDPPELPCGAASARAGAHRRSVSGEESGGAISDGDAISRSRWKRVVTARSSRSGSSHSTADPLATRERGACGRLAVGCGDILRDRRCVSHAFRRPPSPLSRA